MWVSIYSPSFLIVILLMLVTPDFPRAVVTSSVVANVNSLLRGVQSFTGICFTFSCVEAFYFENVFSLPLAIHLNKQVSISSFNVFGGSS